MSPVHVNNVYRCAPKRVGGYIDRGVIWNNGEVGVSVTPTISDNPIGILWAWLEPLGVYS